MASSPGVLVGENALSDPLQAIVLAGGLGTRLRPVLGDVPKVLAPVLQVPWLVWVLQGLGTAGFRRVTFAVGHAKRAVMDAVRNATVDGIDVAFCEEDEALGTGGAIKQAAGTLPNLPTFALNGDTWVGVEWDKMREDFVQSAADLSVALRHVDDRSRYGAAETVAGRIVTFGEKAVSGPGLINAGVYLFRPAWLLSVQTPLRFSFETEVIQKMLATSYVRGFRVEGCFIDIGVPEDLKRAPGFVKEHLS